MRRLLIVLGVILVVLVLLVVLAGTVVFPLLRYLSRPKDLSLAKKNGEELPRVRDEKILVVVAHPDDAEWYAGGALALLVRNGNEVVVVDGTSGEKGGNANDLAATREREQRNAGRIIGYRKTVFLRHPDRGLVNDELFRSQLRKVFDEETPSVVFTFDASEEAFGYRHSDHRAAGAATLEVSKSFPSVRRFYLFSSANPNTLVDVARVVDIKAQALAQHRSQREEDGWARVLLRLLNRLTPNRQDREQDEGAGSAQPYPQVGIGYGEPYRLVRRL